MTEQTQPTDAELLAEYDRVFNATRTIDRHGVALRAVLAKWGTPAGAGEFVGKAMSLPGASGFTMACFHSDVVPLGAKLYTTPQTTQAQAGAVPLTDEQCDAIYEALDAFGREVDHYEYGLPYCTSDGETLAKPEAREVIRQAAQNIKGSDHG